MTKPNNLPFILLITFILSFVSCDGKQTIAPPENVLSKEKVEDVLVDMYLLEAEMRVRIVNENINDIKTWINVEMKILLKKHQVEYNQYTESLTYYMTDLKTSKKIMENAVNRLVKLQAEHTQRVKQVK